MLLSHRADGNLVSVAIHDGNAKQLLGIHAEQLGRLCKSIGPARCLPEAGQRGVRHKAGKLSDALRAQLRWNGERASMAHNS